MDADIHRCKSCGAVFEDVPEEIDKCAKKRIYCDFCLAQKNPVSETEQQIKKKYIRFTAIAAFLVLVVLIAINWGKTKNENFFEFGVVFGIGYGVIWAFTAGLLLPILARMKKPHKEQIRKEYEKYINIMEKKKKVRDAQLEQEEKESNT